MSLKNGYHEDEFEISLDNIRAYIESMPPMMKFKKLKAGEEISTIELTKTEGDVLTFKVGIRKETEVRVIKHNAAEKKKLSAGV